DAVVTAQRMPRVTAAVGGGATSLSCRLPEAGDVRAPCTGRAGPRDRRRLHAQMRPAVPAARRLERTPELDALDIGRALVEIYDSIFGPAALPYRHGIRQVTTNGQADQILAWLDGQREAMTDLLREIVNIDSGSYN